MPIYIFGFIRRGILCALIVSNIVSCSAIIEGPQQTSKRHLNEIDRERYSSSNLHFFVPIKEEPIRPPPFLEVTPQVKSEMKVILSGKQKGLRSNLARGKQFAPTINKVFRDEGIPPQLIYLAMIESGYRTDLKSPMGAGGMWQFMKSTARLYGLEISLFKDERKDIILSTIAAARHLKDLYDKYHNWKLVLAAYNSGSGTVDRAIKRYGSNDFWKLVEKGAFRKETLSFVAKFMAITVIMDDPAKHGMSDLECLTRFRSREKGLELSDAL